MIDGKALVDSVKTEIIEPGIQRLMETAYFSEGQAVDQAAPGVGDPALFA